MIYRNGGSVNRHVLQAEDELWGEMLELASAVEAVLDRTRFCPLYY